MSEQNYIDQERLAAIKENVRLDSECIERALGTLKERFDIVKRQEGFDGDDFVQMRTTLLLKLQKKC